MNLIQALTELCDQIDADPLKGGCLLTTEVRTVLAAHQELPGARFHALTEAMAAIASLRASHPMVIDAEAALAALEVPGDDWAHPGREALREKAARMIAHHRCVYGDHRPLPGDYRVADAILALAASCGECGQAADAEIHRP